jgi:hypothetical protein
MLVASQAVSLDMCLIFTVSSPLLDAMNVGHARMCMAILVVGDRRHPTQALPESRICFSDVQLSSLFNARIPPINCLG